MRSAHAGSNGRAAVNGVQEGRKPLIRGQRLQSNSCKGASVEFIVGENTLWTVRGGGAFNGGGVRWWCG